MNRDDQKTNDLQPIPPVPVPCVQRPKSEDDELDPALKAELDARRVEDEQSEVAQDDLANSGQDASKVPQKSVVLRPRRSRT